MHVGYARVSMKDQTVDLPVDALTQAGCTKAYTEVISGASAESIMVKESVVRLVTGVLRKRRPLASDHITQTWKENEPCDA